MQLRERESRLLAVEGELAQLRQENAELRRENTELTSHKYSSEKARYPCPNPCRYPFPQPRLLILTRSPFHGRRVRPRMSRSPG